MMVRGLVIGKFVPPHRGHKALIEFAQAHCDQLTVLVCENPGYPIPGHLRQSWLQELHPDATVLVVDEQHEDDDSKGWAERTIDVLGFTPDRVFTSEDYGNTYASFLKCEHIAFDPRRKLVPVSGTKIREAPFKHWAYLDPVVRAHFVKRIALVGAESCGKTTLANSLAAALQTYVVPEYGRFYWDAKRFAGDDPIWTTEEFLHIATMQNHCEDHFARRANRFLLCDTNTFLTGIWHRRYLGDYDPTLTAWAQERKYDLVLFCPASIPFVQDGTRDGELVRSDMSDWTRSRLEEQEIPFHTMVGSRELRQESALKLISGLTP